VIVSVIVGEIVPVTVAVHVHGNGPVGLDTSIVGRAVDQLVHTQDVEVRRGLHRRPTRDGVVPRLVRAGHAPGVLRDVLRDRLGRPAQLIGELGVTLRQRRADTVRVLRNSIEH
jgi:hypothetical protein